MFAWCPGGQYDLILLILNKVWELDNHRKLVVACHPQELTQIANSSDVEMSFAVLQRRRWTMRCQAGHRPSVPVETGRWCQTCVGAQMCMHTHMCSSGGVHSPGLPNLSGKAKLNKNQNKVKRECRGPGLSQLQSCRGSCMGLWCLRIPLCFLHFSFRTPCFRNSDVWLPSYYRRKRGSPGFHIQ